MTTNRIIYALTTFILAVGIILTYISSLHICTEACAEGLNYRIFGLPFEVWGFAFFPAIFIVHLTSYFYPLLAWVVIAMLCGGLGSELWFIYVQKYYIGHWCPICLAIASCVFLALVCQIINQRLKWRKLSQNEKEEVHMQFFKGSLSAVAAAVIGFIIAFVGLSKVDKIAAAEEAFKNKIAMGNASSPIEVYLFTDWQCPSCRKIEPVIEKMSPEIQKKAKLFFIDFPIHPETMNFTPYNLAFMINNKEGYLKLRKVLTELSEQTGAPTEEQIQKAISSLGVKYEQLNYADVAVGFKFNKDLAKQFGINSTPTLVLVNLETKKGKKLKGGIEISETNVMNAIDALK